MTKHSSTKTHKSSKHSRILETITYGGEIKIPTSIELIQYNDKLFLDKTVPNAEHLNLKSLINKNAVNWFKITGISDVDIISDICRSFGIQRFDIKDLLSSNRVTKVIAYEHATFILLSGCTPDSSQHPVFNQIAFILGDNYIISIQETQEPIFDDVKEAIQTSRIHFREKGADYLLYILLNDVLSSYSDSLNKITDKINTMEDSLIDDDTEGINVMRFIQARKKEYSSMKQGISSLREEYTNLLHNTNLIIKDENRIYFNDFDDKLRTFLDDLEMFFLSVTSLSDLYFNNNNLRMNNVIKKLTIVSTIFIPLTFMVGVWGMNFESMPELKWAHGYLFAWAIMGIMVILAIFYLKHKKWF